MFRNPWYIRLRKRLGYFYHFFVIMIRIIKEYLKKYYKEVVQQGLIISTFHGSYTVSKEHDRATAAGNHETSDEIMPTTKLPHRFSGEAAVPVNNTVYNTCVYYLFIAAVRSNYGLPITLPG